MKTISAQAERTPLWNRVWGSALGATILGYAVVVLYGTIAPYFV